MRSALVFTTALFAVSALADAASAQQVATNSAGLRYLSWPGKATVNAAPAPAVVPASARGEPALRPVRTAASLDASSAIPLARLDAPSREAPRPGLTPATAFYNPTYGAASAPSNTAPQAYVTAPARQAPTPAPQAAPQPTPQAAVQPAPQPAPRPEARPEPRPEPVMAAANTPAPVQAAQPQPAQPQQQQAYAAEAAPAPAAAPDVVDPMAPRRDAAIFSLQRQPAAAVASDAPQTAEVQQVAQAGPYSQQARYYSVHRQAGRHPDAIAAPQQSYLNALPVELTQVPASKDMAEPDAPPQLIRDANGRIRAMPQSQSDETP
ncbi:hypothetical protein QOZ96_000346 [Brevundimonas nasdae]|uniref:hypothetical protein n=1 Tax=Brevundimonas nasdae TaxID=172043 RepID=UPI001911EC02|nr:hypothetical protein [Brevundimonas nasdae]MBK6023769.1 hypothetical protein [Brevundimonas nasdae]MDQ0450421.1 hypothetical protein [Brevundimonas nasdae]